MDDVWVITNWQAIQWIRNPTPLALLHTFEPFGCHYPVRLFSLAINSLTLNLPKSSRFTNNLLINLKYYLSLFLKLEYQIFIFRWLQLKRIKCLDIAR